MHALERARLDLPELPRVGDRAPPRPAARDDPPVVARAPVRLVEPRRGERRVDLRPDRDARPARRRARMGDAAQGVGRRRARALRRRRDVRGRLPRGREHRRGHGGAARAALQQQPVGDLDAAQRADRGGAARRQGGRVRDARRPRRRPRRSRRVRGRPRGRRAGPRRRAARRSSRRSPTARRPTRPPTTRASTSTRSGSRARQERDCVAVFEGYLRRLGVLDDEHRRGGPRRGARDDARRRSRRPRASRRAERELVFAHAYAEPPASLARDLDELDRVHERERHGRRDARAAPRRGGQRRAPRRARARRHGDGDRRGRRAPRRRLPRDGGPARPVRAGPVRRHAALRGGDPRRRRRALHGRAGGPSSRCSTTPSRTRASTS